MRVRPTVQGAALVLENKTGRILAMAGGFSYPLSQLNRTTQTQRQPGSAIKPLTYLTALQYGLQPNTLVLNEPITFPPIGSGIDGILLLGVGLLMAGVFALQLLFIARDAGLVKFPQINSAKKPVAAAPAKPPAAVAPAVKPPVAPPPATPTPGSQAK